MCRARSSSPETETRSRYSRALIQVAACGGPCLSNAEHVTTIESFDNLRSAKRFMQRIASNFDP